MSASWIHISVISICILFSFQGVLGRPMTPGNLLITQPNSIVDFQFLGGLVQYFTLRESLPVQPVDIRFHPTTGKLLALDFRYGVYVVNRTGFVEGIWGDASTKYFVGTNLDTMTFDFEGNLWVINLNPTNVNPLNRKPNIQKFDTNGKYLGVGLANDVFLGDVPLNLIGDPDGNLWVALMNGLLKFNIKSKTIQRFSPKVCDARTLRSLNAGITFHQNNLFLGVLCQNGSSDMIARISSEGDLLSAFPIEGKTGGGLPSALTFGSDGLLYVEVSDSEDISTDHVQVFTTDGKLVRQFGGNECNDQPPNFLCQPFNGLQFIPK